VRSTHGVNCTGSCSWKIYVKGGIVTWETQQTDYPRTRPDLPNHEPRGCARGASYSWYLYSANWLKYPMIRGRLLELYRAARATLEPVAAWASIVEDPAKSRSYKQIRGLGGFNYYGTVGSNRDEFVIVRRMERVDWLEGPGDAMRIRAQIGTVLNLDKCIGCHTCSVTCKNVWTSRDGVEYAWFNNVWTKPGIGYPKEWENQKKWNGGWVRRADGRLEPRMGGKFSVLAKIFANPDLPQIDDCYEPYNFDYQHLHNAPESKAAPTARPRSVISGERIEKIQGGPNWEEILGGEFAKRSKDANFEAMEKQVYGQFENTFMMYLPRGCANTASTRPASPRIPPGRSTSARKTASC
jgi:hypothetical protein